MTKGKNNMIKHYITYFIAGLLFSILSIFFTAIHAAYFMIGIILGWQVHVSYLKFKQSQGSIYALKIKYLLNAGINIVLSLAGFLAGVGILVWTNII